jgi:hypothetical protein
MLVLRHGLDDGVHSVVLPVERIHTCNKYYAKGKNNQQ